MGLLLYADSPRLSPKHLGGSHLLVCVAVLSPWRPLPHHSPRRSYTGWVHQSQTCGAHHSLLHAMTMVKILRRFFCNAHLKDNKAVMTNHWALKTMTCTECKQCHNQLFVLYADTFYIKYHSLCELHPTHLSLCAWYKS